MSNQIVEDWAAREKYEFASQVLQRTANFINSLELQVTEHYNEIETQLEFLARRITFLEGQAKLSELVNEEIVEQPNDIGKSQDKMNDEKTTKLNANEILNVALKKVQKEGSGSNSKTNTLKSIPAPNFNQPLPPPPAFDIPPVFDNSMPNQSYGGYQQFQDPSYPPVFDGFGGVPPPPAFGDFNSIPNPPVFENYGAPPSFDNFQIPQPPGFDQYNQQYIPDPPSFENNYAYPQGQFSAPVPPPPAFNNMPPPPPPPF
eukprot:NODE_49_length_31687_cov_0.791123.p12 type:complete len:259 gc:universal NODE_49_length_31687_cov_0.791123:27554-28330(+)